MFYGVVDSASSARTIEGMSGGPIIGLKSGGDGGTANYWVIAVQSSWYASSRIVCASPLSESRDVLRQAMKVIFAATEDNAEADVSRMNPKP